MIKPRQSWIRVLFSLALLVSVAPSVATAQGGLGGLLGGPPANEPWFELGYDIVSADGSNGTGDITSGESKVSSSVPLSLGTEGSWAFTSQASHLEIDGLSGTLPGGDPLPDEFWDVEVGLAHRRPLASGRIIGGHLSVGSASDEPFAGSDETVLSLTGTWTLPKPSGSAWILFLNYSNNRSFLNHVPLPGFAYLHRPSERFTAVYGLPFVGIFGKPKPSLRYELMMIAPSQARAVGTWVATDRLELSTGLEWAQTTYLRSGRIDSDDRLFRDEKRATANLAVALGDRLRLTLGGGWAFDRSFFEGQDYGDRNRNPIELPEGPFATLKLERSF